MRKNYGWSKMSETAYTLILGLIINDKAFNSASTI